jgi:UDP-2-acetamido-2-deoxy-ribo-hexuluronate aminotransferase
MSSKVKMVDLQGQYLRIKAEVDAAIQDVLTSTAFIQGPQVQTFAQNLARYAGVPHVVPCANGTDALQIAMMALGLRPGDEVVVPVHTYVATAEVIALLGLTPVFAEVDPRTFNLDVHQLEARITHKTRAIVPVHLYGQCADMEPILKIAEAHNLYVIEDAAQALGAAYTFSSGQVRQAGTMGHVGTTSFFPSKNLGCFGDGGALFTHDAALAEKMRMIANHGQKQKYHHDIIGINSRLDTLQAAILDVKLKYLTEYTRRRNDVAAYYDQALGSVTGLIIPYREPRSTHVFHQYTIQTPQRDALQAHLAAHGIPTMIYYPVPLHLQQAYRRAGTGEGSFAVTEQLSKTVLSLPIHTEMTPAELDFICTTIKNFF